MLNDISTSEDVALMVRTFYRSLLELEEIRPVFDGIDLEAHLPRITAFWEFVLLDKEGYTANVFEKHVPLPLKDHHFDLWLETFERTVRSLFTGEKADMAVSRAQTIGYSFRQKLKHMGKLG